MKSARLAEKRNKMSLIERLQERGRAEKPPQPSFKPSINQKSFDLKLGNVTDRLYGSRRNSVTDESPRRRSQTPKNNRKVEFNSTGYKINTSKGAQTDREINEIRYSAGLEFLMNTIR